MNEDHRKQRLQDMIDMHFGGNRTRFIEETGISKSRLSQLLSPKHQFGEAAAQSISDAVANMTWIDKNWFNLPAGTTRKLSSAERQDSRVAGFYDLDATTQEAVATIIRMLPKIQRGGMRPSLSEVK